MKNRFGPDGITFPCKMNTNTGYIEVYEQNSPDGVIAPETSSKWTIRNKETFT